MFLEVSGVIQKDYKITTENQYTQKDIEKAMDAVYCWMVKVGGNYAMDDFPRSESLEDLKVKFIGQINSISAIEVDEKFNIISYE